MVAEAEATWEQATEKAAMHEPMTAVANKWHLTSFHRP